MKLLIPEKAIESIVKSLAEKISQDYEGKELLVISILKGAFIFTSDLVKLLKIPVKIDFLHPSDVYSSDLYSSYGENILLVEDIIDTGNTVHNIISGCFSANNVKICALLDKPSQRKVKINIDYSGFIIPDRFVVGYGMDYQEKYRNLRDIYILESEDK